MGIGENLYVMLSSEAKWIVLIGLLLIAVVLLLKRKFVGAGTLFAVALVGTGIVANLDKVYDFLGNVFAKLIP